MAYVYDGRRYLTIFPEPDETVLLNPDWIVIANPGAVCGSESDSRAWWLELDLDQRSLVWRCIAVFGPPALEG